MYSKSVKRTLNISIAFLLAFIVFSPVAWTENTCLFKDKNTTYKSDGVNIISVDKENYKDIWINGTLTYLFRDHPGHPGPFLIFITDKEYCFKQDIFVEDDWGAKDYLSNKNRFTREDEVFYENQIHILNNTSNWEHKSPWCDEPQEWQKTKPCIDMEKFSEIKSRIKLNYWVYGSYGSGNSYIRDINAEIGKIELINE